MIVGQQIISLISRMRKVEHMKGESVAQLAVFEGQAAREAAGLKEFTDVGRLELTTF